jgi:hypothetical protein
MLLGALLLFWLPVEDRNERTAQLLGILLCLVLALYLIFRNSEHPCKRIFRRYLVIGTLAGTGVSILTLSLMIFKGGLHGHGFPDYTITQFANVFRLTPVWALLGTLSGLSGALWQRSRCP